ncbi:hypothetical protein A9258_15355 [Aeromonas hydrophila]|nr:hypothetical protein A9258_15355 [Aeromonas hydrophila]
MNMFSPPNCLKLGLIMIVIIMSSFGSMVWVLRDFRARFRGKRALNIVSFIWQIDLIMSSLYRHSAIWKWFVIWPRL